MADWQTFDAADMPFIPEATALLTATEPFLTAAQAVANAARLFLLNPTFQALVLSPPDPMAALRALIDELINDLVNTGVFTLIVKPDLRNRSGLTGIDGFARALKTSLHDQGDLNRPPFVTGDETSGIVFVISAPSFEELSALAESFQRLFGESWKELIDFVAHEENSIPYTVVEGSGMVTSIPATADPKKVFRDSTQRLFTNASFDPYKGQRIQMLSGRNAGLSAIVGSFNGTTKEFVMDPSFRYDLDVGDAYVLSYVTAPSPPDWQSLRVVDTVPVCAQVTEVLASIRDSIPAGGTSDFNARLAALLARKADLFGQIASQIQDVIDLFDNLDATGIHMLTVPVQDLGNEGFIREVFNAGNVPSVGKNDYTMGVVLYGGSGILNVLSKLFPV